jgi:phospholipid/cholesterol/gamma-HCH transport system substrate-binding protein
MTEQGMRFRIGLFVLLALVLLATLVTLFGSLPSLFKQYHEYTVTFADAPGVNAGTPVRRSGIRIGEVKSVDLDHDTGEVRVGLLLERPYKLRRGEEPVVAQGLLGSDTCIDVQPASPAAKGQTPDRTPVEPGSIVAGGKQANIHTLLSRASEVVPATHDTLTQLRQSLERLERLGPLLEETVKEYRDLAKATREAIPEVRRTATEVGRTATEVGNLAHATRDAVPGLSQTSDEVRELARAVREMVPELRRTNDEVCGLVEAARDSVPSLNQTNDEVRQLAHAVRETVPELRHTNEEIQHSVESWGRVGDRVDGLIALNQDKLVKTVDNLNETLVRLSTLFNADNERNLATLLQNVRASSDNLQSITRNTDELLKESRLTVHKVGDSVARADDAMNNLQQATKPLAERSNNVMKNLDESTAKFNATMTELHDLMRVVSQSNGTLQRLVLDPSLYNHLDETVCTLERVLPRLDRILHDLEIFADKVARHPEALGVGGVVSPSSGLK